MKPAKESLELIEKMKELAKKVAETEVNHITESVMENDESDTVYDRFRYAMFQETVCDVITHLGYTTQALDMSDEDIDATCKEADTTPEEYLNNRALKALLSGILGGLKN